MSDDPKHDPSGGPPQALGPANTRAPFPRRTVIAAAVLFAVNFFGAYLLDALGLVEGLLSPSGGRLALLLPLAGVFYAARLLALFVAPGLVLAALLQWAWDRPESHIDAVIK